MTITLLILSSLIAYIYIKNRAKNHTLNLKKVGLAAAHVHILTGCHEALLAAISVKATLTPADGNHLAGLVSSLPDIDSTALKTRRQEVIKILGLQPQNLRDQVDIKLELSKLSGRWSQAVRSADFDVAAKILEEALNEAEQPKMNSQIHSAMDVNPLIPATEYMSSALGAKLLNVGLGYVHELIAISPDEIKTKAELTKAECDELDSVLSMFRKNIRSNLAGN